MAPSLKYIPRLPLHLPFYIAVSVALRGLLLPHGIGSFVNSPKNWWGQSPIWLGGSTEPRGCVYHESVLQDGFSRDFLVTRSAAL